MAIEELLPSKLVFGSLQLLVTVPLLLLTLSEVPREDPFSVRSDLLLLLPPWGELQLRVTTASLLLPACKLTHTVWLVLHLFTGHMTRNICKA